jgi:hypothetical protein
MVITLDCDASVIIALVIAAVIVIVARMIIGRKGTN